MTHGKSITFDNVSKSYGSRKVLQEFDLHMRPGELVCLLGPSGCGKSTVLRSLAGFESISEGDIRIGDVSVIHEPPRSRGVGMVFQQYSLFPNMSAVANVMFGLGIQHVPLHERRTRAMHMLEMVGLAEFAHQFPDCLSGGQQQRVALARALVLNPDVLLLDEPLSALDAKIRLQLRSEIRSLQRASGLTTVFVTHDQEEALAIADRIAIMNEGRIEQIGTPEELYASPATPFVAQFVGHSNQIEARVEANGTVKVCGTPLPLLNPLPAGSAVRVFIRPEHVALQLDADGAARVREVSFLGPFERTTIQYGGLQLVSQHASGMRYVPNDRVDVRIRPVPVLAQHIDPQPSEPAQ